MAAQRDGEDGPVRRPAYDYALPRTYPVFENVGYLNANAAIQVDGPLNNGTAQLHMVKGRGHSDYEYKYLFVEVKGHDRIYLENADAAGASKKKLSWFGVNWG